MAGRDNGGGTGAMEEGRSGEELARYQGSEDGSSRCSGNEMFSVQFVQKIIAEVLGTYFMIFAGCGSVVVNLSTNGTVTFPGICAVWGVVVMVLVYSFGHISGAHFNPAVTVAFATRGRFPWKQVPSYAAAQVLGSGLASLTLCLVFGGARAILRCGAGGVGDAGTGARVRHILLPHVRRLRGGHRQQSDW